MIEISNQVIYLAALLSLLEIIDIIKSIQLGRYQIQMAAL